ncbi:hypothetical protein FPV67DRAFT_1671366 [Lyophyllum atratum]|nr:hypothetical protein FPV67DRAFT_1671366 [Lyophyllum atratum]
MADYGFAAAATAEPGVSDPLSSDADIVRDHAPPTDGVSSALLSASETPPFNSVYTTTFFLLSTFLLISLTSIALCGALIAALSVVLDGVVRILAVGTKLSIALVITVILITCLATTVALLSVVGLSILQRARRGLSHIPDLKSRVDWATFSNTFATYTTNARKWHAVAAVSSSGLSAYANQLEELCIRTAEWLHTLPWADWVALITTAFRAIAPSIVHSYSIVRVKFPTSQVAFSFAEKSIQLVRRGMALLWSSLERNNWAHNLSESVDDVTAPRDTHNAPVDAFGVSTSVSLNIQKGEGSRSSILNSRREAGGEVRDFSDMGHGILRLGGDLDGN